MSKRPPLIRSGQPPYHTDYTPDDKAPYSVIGLCITLGLLAAFFFIIAGAFHVYGN